MYMNRSGAYRAATSNELRGSTQPDSPFARIRRQVPRDSPNSTREFGPIEATMRDCRLAPDRITTQCREYERTHGDVRRARDEAGVGEFCGGAVIGAV
jgi:hypothetical protein